MGASLWAESRPRKTIRRNRYEIKTKDALRGIYGVSIGIEIDFATGSWVGGGVGDVIKRPLPYVNRNIADVA
jgi:hypothetical protein